MKKHLVSAQANLGAENTLVYLEFIKQHEKNLPAFKVAAYGDLQRKVVESTAQYNKAAFESLSQRDRQMADVIRDRRGASGLNLMIVGVAHVTGLAKRLPDLPVMVMVPRALSRLILASKDEL